MTKQQQLKFVEKVMVSVHRGASDVKRLVRESTEISKAESSDLYSLPVSKPLEDVRRSSGEDDGTRNSKMVLTREMPVEQATFTRSSPEKHLGNGLTAINPRLQFPGHCNMSVRVLEKIKVRWC